MDEPMTHDVAVLIACLNVKVIVEASLQELYIGGLKECAAVIDVWDRGIMCRKKRVFSVSLDQFPIATASDLCVGLGALCHTYTLYGLGSELYYNGATLFGNIEVVLNIATHPLYHIDMVCFPHDIHATIYVSLEDYFRGRFFCIPHPSGHEREYIMAYYDCGKNVHVEKGQGLRGLGDIYLHFELVLPKISMLCRQDRLDVLQRILDAVAKT
jgi:hypothetical protein